MFQYILDLFCLLPIQDKAWKINKLTFTPQGRSILALLLRESYHECWMYTEHWLFHNDFIYRRDVISEDESEEEPDPGLFLGCSENQLKQQNTTTKCQILTNSNGPFAKCHSAVEPDFYFTWVSTADSCSSYLQNHFGNSFWQELSSSGVCRILIGVEDNKCLCRTGPSDSIIDIFTSPYLLLNSCDYLSLSYSAFQFFASSTKQLSSFLTQVKQQC